MENVKGFTIIELIVVISIIAVLSAIVSVNVFSYIQKARDAAMDASVSALMKSGVIYFSEHGNYADFFDSSSYINARAEITKKYYDYLTENISALSDAYCACYGIDHGSDKNTLCLDSSGYKKEMMYNKNCPWRCQGTGICQD